MESESTQFNFSEESDMSLPAMFVQVGPVEWACHGLQARTADSLSHGNKRYWVTYCPSNGARYNHTFALL